MKIHRKVFLLLFGISHFFCASAQENPNLGIPFIVNFSKQDYHAGTQNWSFTQDKNGVLYVANNEGLLSYDGVNWQLYPLPNKTIMRSVDIDDTTERIFVGGQDEIGYYEKNERGFLTYQSIKPNMPEAFRNLGDIWTIFHHQEGIYFISLNTLFYFSDDSVQIHPNIGEFLFLGKGQQQVIAQKTNGNVFKIDSGLKLIPIGNLPYEIVSVFEFSDAILLATEKNGIYLYSEKQGIQPWPNYALSFLKDNRVTKVIVLDNNRVAVTTALGGLLVLTEDGRPLYWIDKLAGLQNNIIRSIFEDQDHNLWLGLDNGIDFLSIADPIRFFYPDGPLEGTSYAIEIINDDLYIGTSNGLYATNWDSYYDPLKSRSIFNKIPGSEGQVWGLNVIDGNLLLGHHEGAFKVENEQLLPISTIQGCWLFVADPTDDQFILTGTYNGLQQIKKEENEKWVYQNDYKGFNESSRFIVAGATGDFWVSHPYRGVFKVVVDHETLNTSVRFYGTKDGLPSDTGNHAFHIWGEILICATEGIFKYDPDSDRFEAYDELNNYLGPKTKVRRLFEDSQNNLWYITQEKIGFLKIEDKGLQKEVKDFELQGLHNKLMGGFEMIYPFDSSNVFLGSEKGMIHIDPSKLFDREYSFKTMLHEIHLIKDRDTLLFANQINGQNPDSNLLSLHNKENSFRFSFTSTNFSPFHEISYQYKLKGFDEEWSSWSENNSREYTNLPPGQYTFMVRSGIPDIYTANTAFFSFYIKHPWYATPFAYGIYSFLFLVSIIGLIWVPRRQFEKEKALIQQEKDQKVAYHRAEVKQSKEELMALKNEKLNAEIEHKNKALASTTMHLLQKSELIQKLRTELDRLRNYTDGSQAKREIKRIISLLNDDNQLDDEWEQFFFHFDQVHSDFFKRLKERFPELTAKDQKMCAYLRMNLSSKEIAPLMNISVRGVEISRYRLRKKLDLDTDVHLNEFMMAF